MRLVVADTAPLNYLVLIGHVDLLPVLFEKVFIPEAVRDELRHVQAPDPVREWIADAPNDRDGANVARRKGFAVTGTLGVLDLAARRGMIPLADALGRLKATNFRCRPEIVDALLARHSNGGEDGG